MDAKLWNIGVKVKEVRAKLDYFVALGAELRIHERLATPDGDFEYALLDFAGTRLFLTPTTVFENKLATPLADGLTHAVFEVKDLEKELDRLMTLGTEILVRAGWLGVALQAFFRGSAVRNLAAVVELVLPTGLLTLQFSRGSLRVTEQPAEAPDARIFTTEQKVVDLLMGHAVRTSDLRVEGDKALLDRMVEAFPLGVAPPVPAPSRRAVGAR